MIDDRIKAMITRELDRHGFVAHEWREGDDGTEAVLGPFAALDDDPHDMFFAGDEGELTACVVGSQTYHNERVFFAFTPGGTDGGNEVDPYQLEAI